MRAGDPGIRISTENLEFSSGNRLVGVALLHLQQFQFADHLEADVLGLVHASGIPQVERPREVLTRGGLSEVVVQCVVSLGSCRIDLIRIIGHIVAEAESGQLEDLCQFADCFLFQEGSDIVVVRIDRLQGADVQRRVNVVLSRKSIQRPGCKMISREQIREFEVFDGFTDGGIGSALIRFLVMDDRNTVLRKMEAKTGFQILNDLIPVVITVMLLGSRPVFVNPQVAFHTDLSINQRHVDRVGVHRKTVLRRHIVVSVGGVLVGRSCEEIVFILDVFGRRSERHDKALTGLQLEEAVEHDDECSDLLHAACIVVIAVPARRQRAFGKQRPCASLRPLVAGHKLGVHLGDNVRRGSVIEVEVITTRTLAERYVVEYHLVDGSRHDGIPLGIVHCRVNDGVSLFDGFLGNRIADCNQ